MSGRPCMSCGGSRDDAPSPGCRQKQAHVVRAGRVNVGERALFYRDLDGTFTRIDDQGDPPDHLSVDEVGHVWVAVLLAEDNLRRHDTGDKP